MMVSTKKAIASLSLFFIASLLNPVSGQGFLEDVRKAQERFRSQPGLSLKMTYRLVDEEKGEVERTQGRYAKYGDHRFYSKLDGRTTAQNEELLLIKDPSQKMVVLAEPNMEVGEGLLKFPLDSLASMGERFQRLEEKESGGERIYEVKLPDGVGIQYDRFEFHFDPEEAFFTRMVFHLNDNSREHHPAVDEKDITTYNEPRIVLDIEELQFTDKDPVPRGVIEGIVQREGEEWRLKGRYQDHRLLDRTGSSTVTN